MQHMNLVVVPLGRMALPAVGPTSVVSGSTNMLLGLSGRGMSTPPATKAHSGAGTGVPDNWLRNGMNPPPNSLTFVNVCTSPDRFSKLKAVPGCMVPSAGEKSHEPAF